MQLVAGLTDSFEANGLDAVPESQGVPMDRVMTDTGMRIIVQRTFIEVIDEQDCAVTEATKRVHSAPARVTKSRMTFPSSDEIEPHRHPHGAVQGHEVDDQVDSQADDQGDQETKTTVVIRNLPLDYTRDQLVELLDAEEFACQYDFVYLPIEFSSGANFGYAFVNLTSPEHAVRFLAHFDGFGRWGVPRVVKAVVGWSWTQGLELHIERYRNSPVMHENMLDGCKPIMLDGGVRVDFPPPTKKVPLLRRLRTRCGSRGRAIPLSGPGAISSGRLKAARQPVEMMPSVPEAPCPLLPGLCSAPGGLNKDGVPMMTSPLLAGLKYTNEEARRVAAGRGRKGKKASNADSQESDVYSEFSQSESSTDVPSPYASALSAGSSGLSDYSDTAARHRGGLEQPWSCSMLAEGLVAAPPKPPLPEEAEERPSAGWPEPGSLIEVVGTYPSGEKAIITGFDGKEGTFQVQLLRNGRLTRRFRTIKCRHARLMSQPS